MGSRLGIRVFLKGNLNKSNLSITSKNKIKYPKSKNAFEKSESEWARNCCPTELFLHPGGINALPRRLGNHDRHRAQLGGTSFMSEACHEKGGRCGIQDEDDGWSHLTLAASYSRIARLHAFAQNCSECWVHFLALQSTNLCRARTHFFVWDALMCVVKRGHAMHLAYAKNAICEGAKRCQNRRAAEVPRSANTEEYGLADKTYTKEKCATFNSAI